MSSHILSNSVFLKNLSPLLTTDVVREFLLPHLPDPDEVLRIEFKMFSGSTQRYCQVDFRTSAGVTAATSLNGQSLLGVPLVITVIDPTIQASLRPPLLGTGCTGSLPPSLQSPNLDFMLSNGLRSSAYAYSPRETEAQQLARTVHVANVPKPWTLRHVIDHLAAHVKQEQGMTLIVMDSRLIEGAAADFGKRVALLEMRTHEMAEAIRKLPLLSRTVDQHELIISQAKATVTPREPDNVSFNLPPSVPVPVAYQQLNKLKLQEKILRAKALAERLASKSLNSDCKSLNRDGQGDDREDPPRTGPTASKATEAQDPASRGRSLDVKGKHRRSSSQERGCIRRRRDGRSPRALIHSHQRSDYNRRRTSSTVNREWSNERTRASKAAHVHSSSPQSPVARRTKHRPDSSSRAASRSKHPVREVRTRRRRSVSREKNTEDRSVSSCARHTAGCRSSLSVSPRHRKDSRRRTSRKSHSRHRWPCWSPYRSRQHTSYRMSHYDEEHDSRRPSSHHVLVKRRDGCSRSTIERRAHDRASRRSAPRTSASHVAHPTSVIKYTDSGDRSSSRVSRSHKRSRRSRLPSGSMNRRDMNSSRRRSRLQSSSIHRRDMSAPRRRSRSTIVERKKTSHHEKSHNDDVRHRSSHRRRYGSFDNRRDSTSCGLRLRHSSSDASHTNTRSSRDVSKTKSVPQRHNKDVKPVTSRDPSEIKSDSPHDPCTPSPPTSGTTFEHTHEEETQPEDSKAQNMTTPNASLHLQGSDNDIDQRMRELKEELRRKFKKTVPKAA